MDEPNMELLSLQNVCGGAAEELFQRAVGEVFKNITDVNTSEKAKRSITLTLEFKPYKDRSGAEVALHMKSKTAPVKQVDANVFVARRAGELLVVPRNPRQVELFTSDPATTHIEPLKAKTN